jgi:hypothetical protein
MLIHSKLHKIFIYIIILIRLYNCNFKTLKNEIFFRISYIASILSNIRFWKLMYLYL